MSNLCSSTEKKLANIEKEISHLALKLTDLYLKGPRTTDINGLRPATEKELEEAKASYNKKYEKLSRTLTELERVQARLKNGV